MREPLIRKTAAGLCRGALLLCLLAFAPAAAVAAEPAVPPVLVPETPDPGVTPKGMLRVVEPGRFEVCVPVGWERHSSPFGLSPEERGEFKVVMFGPHTIGVAPEISTAYYAPGNRLFRDMDQYMRLHAQSIFGLVEEGERYGPVRKEPLGGREALRFERDKFVYVGPRRINPEKVLVHERYVALPAKAGFYVLHMSAGPQDKDGVAELFEKTLACFRPLLD